MNIFGKWQIHDILTFDEKQNERHITADEIRAMEDNEENADYKAMLNMVIVVSPETMNTYICTASQSRSGRVLRRTESGNSGAYRCLLHRIHLCLHHHRRRR